MVKAKDLNKVPTAGPKKPRKQKIKDKPKRPLSSYNYFVKEERKKILAAVKEPENVAVNDPESTDYIDKATLCKLKMANNKVSFEEVGKLLGYRWKRLCHDRLARFAEMASDDAQRYKQEMDIYNHQQSANIQNENRVQGQFLYYHYPHHGAAAPFGTMPPEYAAYASYPYAHIYASYNSSLYAYQQGGAGYATMPPPGFYQEAEDHSGNENDEAAAGDAEANNEEGPEAPMSHLDMNGMRWM